MDNFIEELFNNEQFEKISPKQHAENLRIAFKKDITKWYKAILPTTAVENMILSTNNDYSEIWDEYCARCFKSIDKHLNEDCYVSQDGSTWLCEHCYNYLVEKYKNYLKKLD